MKTISITLIGGLATAWAAVAHAAVTSVVLVHGAFADGSGWKPVADILERDGYTVYVVRSPRPPSRPTSRRRAWCSSVRDLACSWGTAMVE